MASRLDAAASVAATTLAYAISAASNRCLIVGVQTEGTQSGNFTCDYGGQAMQFLVQEIAGSGATQQTVGLFFLNDAGIAAAAGTTITPGNTGTPGDLTIHARSYQDCVQTTPGNTDTDTTAAATPNPLANCDITTSGADALVMAFGGMGNSGTAAWAGPMTEQTDLADASSTGSFADDEVPSATTIACELTWTTPNRSCIVAVGVEHQAAAAGITGVVPTEFDMDAPDVDVDGSDFESTQTTGTIYLSDANTLAGSANEVDVSSAVVTWNDTQINLDFTQLSAIELDALQTLGPGQRFFIVLTSAPNEYASLAITLHRPQAFCVSLSDHIAASGEDTTFQLIAPATKTTGDFGGGRIQDDENPGDAVDIGLDEYREDEWSMQAKPLSETGATYQFRICLADGTELDTYTADPRWTIIAAAVRRVMIVS